MGLVSAIPIRWRQLLKDHRKENYEKLDVDEAPKQTLSNIIQSSKKPYGQIYKLYVNDANDQPWDRFDKC